MKHFFRNAGHGYMMIAEPFNMCWSYLVSREWCHSTEDKLYAIALLAALIPASPVAYLCVAPIVAFRNGMREEGE